MKRENKIESTVNDLDNEVNMWCPCCMMSFVLDPSTLFSASCDLTLTLCSKNRKIIKQNENENEN